MKNLLIVCIIAMAIMSSTQFQLQAIAVNDPEPIDFHKQFSYQSCKEGVYDLINQAVVLYGDVYGTVGINTALYRFWQLVIVRFPAATAQCKKELFP
mmetsp:Transcript_28556/g.32638  ORF Transcript_28556/g.32638 Transcript_28556/m.32638 type:complete len:97 (-) Transcript_28556:34-324(-)